MLIVSTNPFIIISFYGIPIYPVKNGNLWHFWESTTSAEVCPYYSSVYFCQSGICTWLVCVFRRVFLNAKWSSLAELDACIDSVNSDAVRETCMKYIYDKCPVVSGYGT